MVALDLRKMRSGEQKGEHKKKIVGGGSGWMRIVYVILGGVIEIRMGEGGGHLTP
jgi:hypothetical protein